MAIDFDVLIDKVPHTNAPMPWWDHDEAYWIDMLDKRAVSCWIALDPAVKANGCTFHHGRTIHYSRGNVTADHRRAFLVNFRPAAMIAFEREQGFDHLGKRDVRQLGQRRSPR